MVLSCFCLYNCLACHVQQLAQGCTCRYLNSTKGFIKKTLHSNSVFFFFNSVGAGGILSITLTSETLNRFYFLKSLSKVKVLQSTTFYPKNQGRDGEIFSAGNKKPRNFQQFFSLLLCKVNQKAAGYMLQESANYSRNNFLIYCLSLRNGNS